MSKTPETDKTGGHFSDWIKFAENLEMERNSWIKCADMLAWSIENQSSMMHYVLEEYYTLKEKQKEKEKQMYDDFDKRIMGEFK
jgi:hypothetical protein